MHKLVIVDDEKVVIDGLTSAINWKEHQIEIVGTASDGKEAFQCIVDKKPNIVLADIQMPELNGLDLIQKVKNICPDTVFIIISGYTEFDYAKRAIELEAVDYLVKPIGLDDIVSSVKKAANKYEKMQAEKQHHNQIQKYQSELEEKYVLDFILGHKFDHFETYDQFKNCKIVITGFKNSTWKNHIKKSVQEFLECLKTPFKKRGYEAFIYIIEDSIVTMYAHSTQKQGDDSLLVELLSLLQDELKSLPIIGVSNTYNDLSYTNQSYKEAKEAFRIGVYLNQLITNYNDLEKINNTVGNEIIEKIENHFKKKQFDLEKMNQLIDDILNYSIEHMLSPVKSKYLCFKLINYVSEYVNDEFEIEIENISGGKFQLYGELNNLQSIEGMSHWLKNFVNETFNYLNKNKISYKDKLILDVKNYLKNHFGQPIVLDDIAECFHISAAYLSSIFSKKVGMTIFEYITDLRMNKAKELLRTTNYKIHEICNEVGYDNQGYFNQVFKKQIGITPGQYRSKHLLGNES
ncbi:response regulator [Bacillus taeanensis]|uniref:DNA-binding response regulator n=1 Tax=Bacillus taeanensis TaxID=273032 RepID=A0A366XYU3_9BACI|nr:response regulator [Bacillus taeanensis]RBW70776.1 hypothetical protein DS031_04670 [Bacillus taeanensis]